MNVADSRRVAAALEKLSYTPAERAEDADVIVLNTCVVRQSAEDKAYGRLNALRPLKKQKPEVVINLMGCLVGNKENPVLKQKLPFVDVFSAPSDPQPLLRFLAQREGRQYEETATRQLNEALDGEFLLPASQLPGIVSAQLPIVLGCSHACTYCVIPLRRGAEISRPPQIILQEAQAMVGQGVKEITLLGQIVDRYGKDQPAYPRLEGLLTMLSGIEGLERIRFLTSHPNWMTEALIEAVASLPKVMPHIEVPIQAGDDEVLARMRRGYTVEQYIRLIERIRQVIPGVSIGTDIIVGFPGETETQFQHTYDLLEQLRLDVVHLARYSPRPGTVSARNFSDDVPDEEKWRRFRLLEDQQERIAAEINAALLNQVTEVLFEEKAKGRWKGRNPNNKLVFVESGDDLRGKILPVRVNWSGPWSMIGELI